MADTKPCPHCAEQIAATAKKCRFCNEWLDKKEEARLKGPPGSLEWKPCPKCRLQHGERVSYTWWGGLLGPRLFSHVRCKNCKTEYNGKTGESNATAIALYVGVSVVIVGGLIVLGALAKH